MNMRACLITYKFYESAPPVQQFACALSCHGADVDIICLRRRGQATFERCKGVNLYRIQERVTDERHRATYLLRILTFFLHAAVLLGRRHLCRPYHLIHVQSVPDFLVFAAIIPRIFRVPVILDAQDLVPEFYASKFVGERRSLMFRLLTFVERASTSFASHVIVPTHLWQRRLLARSVKPSKCSVIRYLPDVSKLYPRARPRKVERFLMVYPGTLNWHQGVHVAMKAFARVLPNIPHAQFHIYGEGPAKPGLVDLAASLGLADKVKFMGMVPKDDVIELMAQCDVAVEPKLTGSAFANETCSLKLLEFLALGIPVVASRTKVHSMYYDDSMVRFYDHDSEEELAEAILLLHRDSHLRSRLVAQGLKYVQSYNWRRERRRYCELIDRFRRRKHRRFPARFHVPRPSAVARSAAQLV
jgi:glycosyltransferase involved in cell wall biosynthesis